MEEEDGGSSWVLRAKFSHTFVRSKSLRPLESTLSDPPLLPLSSSSSSSAEQAPPVGTTNRRSTSRVQSTPSKMESLPPRAGERTTETKNPGGSSEFSFHSDDRRSSLLNSEFCTGTLKHDAGSSPATTSAPRRDERNSRPKQRSVSPLPATILSDAFKEARLTGKRFSTPPPSRRRFEATSQRRSSDGSRFKQSPKAGDRPRSRSGGGSKVASVDATDEWNAELSELYIGVRFASGAHSKLYHGIYKDKKVAVKAIRQPDDDEILAARLEEEFTREVMLLSHLNHPNVIKLAGACKDPPVFFIITEYLSGGSLRAFLHKLDHGTLPLPKVIGIALEIARGMEYIHSQGIVHRDLKPENILFDEEFHIKVVDFGIACEERYCYALAEDAGTYRWMAPEIIKHKHYGRKVDVYSFGLILWEMLTGVIPYADMTPEQAAFAVIDKNLRPVIPPHCPAPLHVLIEQCWTSHPDKRPEFWQIVKVLEQFESAITRDGNLNQCQNLTSQDHKNKLLHWLDKLKPFHPDGSGTPPPKLL